MRTKRVRLAFPAAALVALAGVGAWAVLAGGDAGSVEQAVADFFEARVEGDCEAVRASATEASWSEDGRFGRDEFAARCSELIEDYQPGLGEVEIVSEDDDRALVQLTLGPREGDEGDVFSVDEHEGLRVDGPRTRPLDSDSEWLGPRIVEEGRLVREGGRWKVEIDGALLRLGPPAEQRAERTLLAYIEAHQDGDCEEMIGYLTDDAWSEEGRLDRDEFLDECAESADARGAPTPDGPVRLPHVGASVIEATRDGDGTVTLAVFWNGTSSTPVTLVEEGMEWRLGAVPDVVGLSDLAARVIEAHPLLDDLRGDPVLAQPASGFADLAYAEGADAGERREETGFERGVYRHFGEYPSDMVDIMLFEFEDAEGASAYAQHWGDRVAADATASRDDISPSPVPRVDSSLTMVTSCAGRFDDGCERASETAAIGTVDEFLVAVSMRSNHEGETGDEWGAPADDLVDDAVEILEAQIGLLAPD